MNNQFHMVLWGGENTTPKEDLVRRRCLTLALKNKEGQHGMGWGTGNTFQGKTAACAKAQQCERPLNLGNCKQHNTSTGQGKSVGRSEIFLSRKLCML